MTRRVLVCTIGATPQIVTETVWALLRDRQPAWIPDEIEIVTTTFALRRIHDALQTADGPLARLIGARPPTTIFLPRRNGGTDVLPPDTVLPADTISPPVSPDALRDVSSGREAEIMGDLILRRIARATSDEEIELHVSLAGGRKTMSAHALMALSVFGRSRDQASHVLVNPPEFEDHPEFWYPDQVGLIVRRDELRLDPRPAPSLDPARASVVLVRTPTALMRYRVEDPARLASLTLAETVQRANLAEAVRLEPSLVLHASTNEIELCGVRLSLGPKLFALFRLMAEACRQRWSDPDPRTPAGWLTMRGVAAGTAADGMPLHAHVRRYLQAAIAAAGGDPEDTEDRVLASWDDAIATSDPGRRATWIGTQLRPNLSHLHDELEDAFGEVAARELLPRGERQPGGAAFGLSIPAEAIAIR
jgi:CRISPR-associated protein (TIGR02584 family)